MYSVSIQHDLPTIGIFTSDMVRRQMPFVTMRTLNNLAFDVQNHTVEKVWARAFEQRNKRFANLTYSRAEAKKTRLVASVFDRFQRANLEDHAVGGTKTPRGKHVAIPSRTLAARRSGKGVPKSMRPRVALDRPKVFKTSINGVPVIARRKRKTSLPIEVLYTMKTSVKIGRSFPFYSEAQRTIDREIGKHFEREFEKASRTAKPRSTSRR